jgi:DNA-binding beta-propeller fold protein YncE
MPSAHLRTALASASCLLLAACGGGGGGGGGDGPGGTTPQKKGAVETLATTATDGSSAQVDLVNGGNPDAGTALDAARQEFFSVLTTLKGADLDGDLVDLTGDGVPDSGFDAYLTGLPPGPGSALILGANNLYDMFQTRTGPPKVALVDSPPPNFLKTFKGFDGGDVDSGFAGGNAAGDGGPGLHSNVPGSPVPGLPVLPAVMGGGRGPSPQDQHQFLQVVFPYPIDADSLFNVLNADTSFLGDSAAGATDNVFVEARWVQRPDGDTVNAVDQTFQHRHVSGVAIVGGVCAVPTAPGLTTLSTVDPALSNLPAGCLARVMDPNVLTFVAHEDPTQIGPTGSELLAGTITGTGVLVLPDPQASAGGGRVFGSNTQVPGAVNDFELSGATDAQPMGFFSVHISRLRSKGKTIEDPYFHSFPLSQELVGLDPRAVDGRFDRGPAIVIEASSSLPAIDILDPETDAIGFYDPLPDSDAENVVSTRARFLVRFDREVVPNSVGFSRKYTVHSTDGQGIVFPFGGNVRPEGSPGSQLKPGAFGSPLAPSIYLAVNQPAGPNLTPGSTLPTLPQKVNSPAAKAVNGVFDDGTPLGAELLGANGLVPQKHNSLATLPRGVVPCDIYPLNQNNLNAYVVEPLVELPPGSVVTLGVCVPGLGWSVLDRTNHGNFTRAGTVFTPFQSLSAVGLAEDASIKQAIIGNDTIIKVNAGPMDLQGNLFYGGTSLAIDQLLDGDATNDLTTGGSNVSRTFRVGFDDKKVYVNAPVAPQALVLAYSSGGLGVLDLAGTGYNTNRPGGSAENEGYENYLEVSTFLSPALTGFTNNFNWGGDGSVAGGDHVRAFGLLSRYVAGGAANGLPPGTESELAVGGLIGTGPLTPVPGINEGSSGYETLVRTGITGGNPASSSQVLAPVSKVGVVRDVEIGEFLDTIYFDADNLFASPQRHRSFNTPVLGSLDNNSIADPPLPNPPPLRFPVGLPHTAVVFDQSDLTRAPFLIEGTQVFKNSEPMWFDDGTGVPSTAAVRQVNGLIQLNPTANDSNGSAFDKPHLPKSGFASPFVGPGGGTGTTITKYVMTGPAPRTATAGAVILATLNAASPGNYDSGGIVAPVYQSRQQIGNFLFVADGVNKKLHALNSNTMEVLQSLSLPDPYGLGLSHDLATLYVSNEGDDSLSVVDADPTSDSFMTERKRIPVGSGPRSVTVTPDNEDVFVCNFSGSSISIVDVPNSQVRKTLTQGGLDQPWDVAIGMREGAAMPSFQSGTYHAYISNFGGDNVLVFQSGPSGLAGIGYDSIVGAVKPNEPPQAGSPTFLEMFQPRGICYDPVAPTPDGFGQTVGCFVAHKDQNGRAVVTRIAYTKDTSPGVDHGTMSGQGSFGATVFEVTQQYVSTFTGVAYDVALPDFNRDRLENEDFGSFYNLFNAGCTPKSVPSLPRNSKYPLADNLNPLFTNGPRWEPDRLYLSVGGKLLEVFDLDTGTHLKTITTPQDVSVIGSYFGQ